MTILARLALLFVVVPILELVLLIQLGQVVGLWPTLLLVVLTGATGAVLARAEGMRVFWQFQKELATGRLPGQAMLDAISVLVGGAFLLTPGILTDVAGFSLLLPPTRRWLQKRVRASLEKRLKDGTVKVVNMGPGMWGAGPFTGGFQDGPFSGAGQDEPSPAAQERLDPAKEIRMETPES